MILGESGSGKSVMCKYLASELSDFCLAESHTNEGTPRSWLGSPRLPILIRVARFAKYIDSFRLTGSLDSALFDFLGEQAHDFEATAGVPGIPQIRALCQKAVLDNRAVLLIDGLDEVVESKLRSRICIAVERFIGDYVLDKERLRRPVGEGNQVVITSRVTGYHLAPLRLETVSHFLIRPLDDAAVRDLCEHLGTLQYPGKRHAEFIGPELFRRLDERSAEDASLDRIKRNPLLLTVLFFYFKKERQLPASRAELYRKLVLDLARNWRLNERDRPPGLEDTDALAWERLRTELNKDENILSLLCRIAERVHSETEWAGRITRRDLETCVDGALREVGIFDTREPHGVVADCRDILFRLISQYMGILVELGQDIFGFIHLTFQEYLVGFGMIHDLASSGPEQRALELGRLFLDQMDDPRWKEPLLFAYGILALEKDTACRTKLFEVVRLHRTEQSPEATALFLVDLIREVPLPGILKDELRAVLIGVINAYRSCTSRDSEESRRCRLSEKIAELRRLSPDVAARVDDELYDLFNEDPDPAPIAHLLWSRFWLSPRILRAFHHRSAEDKSNWHWSMHTALRQCIPANRFLPVRPAELPKEDVDSESPSARAILEGGLEVWKQKSLAFKELSAGKEDFKLPELEDSVVGVKVRLQQNEALWRAISTNTKYLRLALALFRCVDDIQAIHWHREYVDLAMFLQRSNSYREARIESEPERFVWRWG